MLTVLTLDTVHCSDSLVNKSFFHHCWCEVSNHLVDYRKPLRWTITGCQRPGWVTWVCLNTRRTSRLIWWTGECWTHWAAETWRDSSTSATSTTRPVCSWRSSSCRSSASTKRSDHKSEFTRWSTVAPEPLHKVLLDYAHKAECDVHYYAP